MLFKSFVVPALIVASHFSIIAANPLVLNEVERSALKRDHFNGITSELITRHAQAVEQHEAKNAEFQRRDLEWNPQLYWQDGGFGFQSYSITQGCETRNGKKWYYGFLVRMVSFVTPSNKRTFDTYKNETKYYSNAVLPNGQKECNRWGQPLYNPGTQCVDKIKLSNGQWAPRSTNNANVGWFSGDPAYGGKSVRHIFDCLLNRTAVEYRNVHPDIGFKPVQYELENNKYYRFYDKHDFAWFAICPRKSSAMSKRQSKEKMNYNPIWDFLPPREHNPLADTTNINKYGISGMNENKRFAIYYFPPLKNHFIWINGEECGNIAVSRPGLRHWTVRLYYGNDRGYPQKKDEYVPSPAEYAPNGNY